MCTFRYTGRGEGALFDVRMHIFFENFYPFSLIFWYSKSLHYFSVMNFPPDIRYQRLIIDLSNSIYKVTTLFTTFSLFFKQFYYCPFLKKDWVLRCYISWKAITKVSYNEVASLEAQQALRWVHGGALVGDQGEKTLAFLCLEGK